MCQNPEDFNTMAKDLEKIFCAKCNKKMELVLIPKYEFEEGVPLYNVESYKCFNCIATFFTEEQSKSMEELTERVRQNQFHFERKVSICGKSLVVGIPAELAQHTGLKKGAKVTIFPISKNSFKIIKV